MIDGEGSLSSPYVWPDTSGIISGVSEDRNLVDARAAGLIVGCAGHSSRWRLRHQSARWTTAELLSALRCMGHGDEIALASAVLARSHHPKGRPRLHAAAANSQPRRKRTARHAVAKAGTSPLNDVIEYAQPATERGLVFMDSPGFDPCSVTSQVASGANIVAFTTGRGSAFGLGVIFTWDRSAQFAKLPSFANSS